MPAKEKTPKKQHNAVPSFSKLLRKLRSKKNNDASTIGGFPVSIGEIRSMRLHKYSEISGMENEEPSDASNKSDVSHSRSRRRRANHKNQSNTSSHSRSSTSTTRNELNLRASLSCKMRKRNAKKEQETQDPATTEREYESGCGSSRSDDKLEIYEQSSSSSRYSDSSKEKDAASAKSKSKPSYSPWDDNGVPPPPPPSNPPPTRCGRKKSRNKKNKSGAFPSLNGQTFKPKASYSSDTSTFFSPDDDECSEITGISGMSSQSTPMDILRDLEDLNPIMEEPESAESGASDEEAKQLHSQRNRHYLFELKEAPQIEEQLPPSRGNTNGSSRKLRTRNLMAKLVNTVQEQRNPNQGEKEIGRFVERDDTPEDEDDIPFDFKQDNQQSSHIAIGMPPLGISDVAASEGNNEAGSVTHDKSEISCFDDVVKTSTENDMHEQNRLGTNSLSDFEADRRTLPRSSRFEDEDLMSHPRSTDMEKVGTTKTKKHSIKKVICMLEEGTVPPGFPETITLEPSTRSRSTVARELESIDKMVEMCNERGGNYQEGDWMEDSRDPPSADEAAGEHNLSTRVDMAYSPSPRASPSTRPDPDGYVTPSEELFGLAVINETDENERIVTPPTMSENERIVAPSTMSVYDSVYSFCGETIRSL